MCGAEPMIGTNLGKKIDLTKRLYTARKRSIARRRSAQNRDWDSKMVDKAVGPGVASVFRDSTMTHAEFDIEDLDYADNAYIGSKSELKNLPRHPEIDRLINDDGFTLNSWDGR
jgi:hypothetical protein